MKWMMDGKNSPVVPIAIPTTATVCACAHEVGIIIIIMTRCLRVRLLKQRTNCEMRSVLPHAHAANMTGDDTRACSPFGRVTAGVRTQTPCGRLKWGFNVAHIARVYALTCPNMMALGLFCVGLCVVRHCC